MKIRLKKINFIDCKFLIACITFLLISSNVIAQEWIEITTPADKLKYQISPGTLATVKFSGDFYILIDGRYLTAQGSPQKKEEVAIRETECNQSSGNIIVKRENSPEIQIPFSSSNQNLPYKIVKIVCGTYKRVKKLIDE